MRIALALLALTCLLVPVTFAEAQTMTRETIDLSVDWHIAPLREPDLTFPPPDGLTWHRTDARLFSRRGDSSYGIWYLKNFDVPASFGKGKRLKLEFGGAKYTAIVYVNGQEVGSYNTGFVPFSFDVTRHIRPGQPNEIIVGVGGIPFTLKRQVPDPPRNLDSLVNVGPIGLNPVGLLAHEVGLWDGVRLVAYNPVRISDVFIQTSFRDKKITSRLLIANESSEPRRLDVSAVVIDGDDEVLELPSKTVDVAPDGAANVTVTKKWSNPKLWFPDSPHLYHLRLTVSEGDTVLDSCVQRFGFREFWTDGAYFRLNGVKLKLRGVGTHFFAFRERGWDTKQGAMELLENLKQKNFNIIRFHAQIWPAHMYEAADEVGFLTVPESPMWTRVLHYADVDNAKFWDNARAQVLGMVVRDRNHPSVAFWSVENEFLHMVHRDERKFSTIKREIAKIGRAVKSLDPSRPIMYAADLDPEGTADVLSLHYVVEYPNFNLIPDEYYWLDEPVERSPGRGLGMLHPEPWTWDRKKPLFITEFAWIPFQTPDHLSGIIGDGIYYGNMRAKHQIGKGMLWQMAIEAFRFQELSGMSPWTPFEGGGSIRSIDNSLFDACERSYAPIAAFVKEYNKSFYEDAPVSRTVTVYNDALEPKSLQFSWSAQVAGDSTPFATGAETLNLSPADLEHLTINFRTPAVDVRTPATLRLVVRDGDRIAFDETKNYSVFPALEKPVALPGKLKLYDASGQTSDLLRSLGVQFEKVSPPFNLDPKKAPVLVIGKDSLDYNTDTSAHNLSSYVSRGGRLLILEQERILYHHLAFLPVPLHAARGTTIAFPRSPANPVLRELAEGDFSFWSDRHILARTSLTEPASGNFVPIIDCSDGKGLVNSLLMEIPSGSGAYILSTIDFHALYGSEPLADLLLARLLEHAFTYQRKARNASMLSSAPQLSPALEDLNVALDTELLLSEGDPTGKVVIVSGDAAWKKADSMRPALRKFVGEGGTLFAHSLTLSHAEVLSAITGAQLVLEESHTPHVAILHDAPQLDIERKFPLASGISSRSASLFAVGRRGRVDSPHLVIDISRSPGFIPLAEPAVLGSLSVGKGFVVLDQVPWDNPTQGATGKASQYASTLLTNLGIELGLSKRKSVNVDLARFCNRGFRDMEAGDGTGGWTDRGRDDMRFFPDPSLGDWIPGMQRPVVQWERSFAGIPFKVIDPEENSGRSCVVVSTTDETVQSKVGPIPVGAGGSALYFLFAVETEDDTAQTLGDFVIRMRDGRVASYPIAKDRHAYDWRKPPGNRYSLATPAWVGPNLVRDENAVYLYSITPGTPFPPVESISVEADPGATVILLGITVIQDSHATRGRLNERNSPRRR